MFTTVIHKPDQFEPSHEVLLRVGSKTVTVWVAKNHCRYFPKDELPDVFKRALAMISTCNNSYLGEVDRHDAAILDYDDYTNRERFFHMLYITSKKDAPEEFRDIGWRVNDKYYYVVVPESTVNRLIVGAEKFDRNKV